MTIVILLRGSGEGILFQKTPRKAAAFYASMQWAGETCVGLIPLLAYAITHAYAKATLHVMLCPDGVPFETGRLAPPSCIPAEDSVSQEMCILTVVISGLALLSFFNLGPRKRKAAPTWISYCLGVAAILALLGGALLYALFGVHLAQDADNITFYILVMALGSSLSLAVEGAIMDA